MLTGSISREQLSGETNTCYHNDIRCHEVEEVEDVSGVSQDYILTSVLSVAVADDVVCITFARRICPTGYSILPILQYRQIIEVIDQLGYIWRVFFSVDGVARRINRGKIALNGLSKILKCNYVNTNVESQFN